MKKKIHKLALIPEDESLIFGIVSSLNDYRLSWAINKQCRWNLHKTQTLVATQKTISYYLFDDPTRNIKYRLVPNRPDIGVWVKELKNIDFFLHIAGQLQANEPKQIKQELKQIPQIRAIFELNINDLNKKKIFLF